MLRRRAGYRASCDCVATALVAILGVVITGCGSHGGEPATRKLSDSATPLKRGTIGVSVLTLTNPFFKTIADTITAEAAKQGYEVIALSGELDVQNQARQIDDFIVHQVVAIVLCPCDSRSITPALQKAAAAGIPVFTADIACLSPDSRVISHIATDNYGGGKQAGDAMIEALGPAGGKVVILDFKQAESCQLRVKGFREVIDRHNVKHPESRIAIVAELPGDGQKDKGYRTAEDTLQAHTDLAGIFAINDPSALGARAAVEKADKARQVKIIGFDGQADGKLAIRDGKIYADPIQFPERIGAMAVESVVRYFRGDELPREQLIPTALYRQADGKADQTLPKN
ncbi:MAG: substrate-binding domain-containing protein [Planctomycetes bacterium]|nr:substrate-binding domain-containing protein [Planctomycetota bacterium]